MPKRGGTSNKGGRVRGVITSKAILRSRQLTLDALVLLGHTKRGAASKVAHLTFPEE